MSRPPVRASGLPAYIACRAPLVYSGGGTNKGAEGSRNGDGPCLSAAVFALSGTTFPLPLSPVCPVVPATSVVVPVAVPVVFSSVVLATVVLSPVPLEGSAGRQKVLASIKYGLSFAPNDAVLSLGGGVVESAESKDI